VKVILDENVPVQVRRALPGHDVLTAGGLGWKGRENGELLDASEQAGFDVLILADKNFRYQQNLSPLAASPTPEQGDSTSSAKPQAVNSAH
jgi:hypothetical protein